MTSRMALFKLPGKHPSEIFTPFTDVLDAGVVDQSETAICVPFIIGVRPDHGPFGDFGYFCRYGGMTESDTSIEKLEAELQASRFQQWDVDAFLIRRHQAKIDALTEQNSKAAPIWQITKEIGIHLLAAVGCVAILSGLGAWLLTGRVIPNSDPVVLMPPPPSQTTRCVDLPPDQPALPPQGAK